MRISKQLTALLLITLTASTNVGAKAYKCEANGKTTYQQSPCANDGTEIQLKDDFNPADYNAAQQRLNNHNQRMAAEQIAKDEYWEKRRIEDIDYYTLRARRSSAIAEHRQANELRRRGDLIKEQNRILRER